MESEALKLALEALESSDKLINGSGNHFGLDGAMDGYYSGCFDVGGNNKLLNKAITAIKEALAQPAQEPVGSVRWGGDEVVWTGEPPESGALLYTTPPQREWNAALDEAAARIGEIKGFGKATQDSFAIYIRGLKR